MSVDHMPGLAQDTVLQGERPHLRPPAANPFEKDDATKAVDTGPGSGEERMPKNL